MLQIRLDSRDPRWYNINRDIAYNFSHAIRLTASRLENAAWPALAKILKEKGITDEDLGRACQALCLFVASSADNPKETMWQSLTRSGWDKVPEEAQIAVMAVLGTVMIGYYWSGVREATINGVGPAMDMDDLRSFGLQSSRLLSGPRWLRFLRRLVDPVFRWLDRKSARVWSVIKKRLVPEDDNRKKKSS